MTVTTTERVSKEAYLRLALDDPDHHCELHHRRLREKPGMSVDHSDVMFELGVQIRLQLNRQQFRVRANSARLHRPSLSYYIPDLLVVPADLERAQRGRPGTLETYDPPLPLVVEVWSPSTGGYDVDSKLPEYQRRGDQEIWRIHPYERTLRAWRRQPDGTYAETLFQGGTIEPVALPGVSINIDALFEP